VHIYDAQNLYTRLVRAGMVIATPVQRIVL
jgi:hypothetical protein